MKGTCRRVVDLKNYIGFLHNGKFLKCVSVAVTKIFHWFNEIKLATQKYRKLINAFPNGNLQLNWIFWLEIEDLVRAILVNVSSLHLRPLGMSHTKSERFSLFCLRTRLNSFAIHGRTGDGWKKCWYAFQDRALIRSVSGVLLWRQIRWDLQHYRVSLAR